MANLAKSGAFSSVFVIYGAIAAFLAISIVSNNLGEAGAGEFFQIMALFSIGTSLSVFGADTGLVRTVSAQTAVGRYSAVKKLIRFALLPSLCIAIAITLLALLYTLDILSPNLDAGYRITFRVTAVFLIAAAVMTIGFGVLRGLNRVVTFTALQNLLLPTLRILAILWTVAYAGNMVSLSLAWTIPVIIVAALAWLLVRRHMPRQEDAVLSGAAPEETFKSFWGFSSARGFSAVVETVLEWVDVLCVALFLGAGASGIYGVVNRMVRMGVMVEHIGRVVTGPSISAALATGDKKRARRIFLANTRVLIAIGWPFYISLAFFGPTLMEFFGEGGFAQGAGILWVICPAMMIAMSAGGVQSVLLMSGKSRWQLYNKVSALVVSLVLNFTLVPLWGLFGAATAWAAAVLVDTFLATYQVLRLVGIRAKLTEMYPVMFLGTGVPVAIALITTALVGQNWWAVLLYLLLAAPIYLLLLYRFREAVGISTFFPSRTKKSNTKAHQKEDDISGTE